MKFHLCSGTKNSFIFIDEKKMGSSDFPSALRSLTRSDLAKTVCTKLGSGADGLVIVKTAGADSELDYEWDFYNNDGSSAEMCGNASRCMGYYAFRHLGCQKPDISFKSLAGTIRVKRLGENVFSVRMPNHQSSVLWGSDIIESMEVKFCALNTGVPHAVIEVADLDQNKLLPLVKHFRFHKSFGKAGANVSFFANKNGVYEGITFERGVEGFTASCGTGVVALALSIFNKPEAKQMSQKGVDIKTPGGQLRVELDSTEKFCWLIGPAGLDEEIEVF
jgi:diaminopimelate epimerase